MLTCDGVRLDHGFLKSIFGTFKYFALKCKVNRVYYLTTFKDKYCEKSTFPALGSLENITQHQIFFPTVYDMSYFEMMIISPN